MKNKYILNIFLNLDVDFFFLRELNAFFFKNKIGVLLIRLPSIYFFKTTSSSFSSIFLNKKFFFSFFRNMINTYRFFFKIYFFRLKLKGLGYRIRKINKKIFRFFLAYNHYFYFFVPENIFVWTKKRNLLALSNNKVKLNNIFSQLVLLKKMDFLEKTKSFIVPKRILYLKK